MDTTIYTDERDGFNNGGKLAPRGILLVLSNNFFGTTFIVDGDVSVVGRSDRADIIIKDDLISREHCRIVRDEGNHFYIEDMGSTNSLSINGKKLKKPRQLCYGDRISMGETVIRFFREEAAD